MVSSMEFLTGFVLEKQALSLRVTSLSTFVQ